MSPRRPHLRNRKRIKAPRRFEDAGVITSSPRQESYEELEESSELEEEIYKSPKPKKPKSKPRAYHGQVIEFNPDLPPAAFPTLDHPDYIHNGGNVPIDLESHLSRLQSREPRLAGFEAVSPSFLGRGCHRKEIDLTGDHPNVTSTAADFTRRESQHTTQTSITVEKQPRASMPSNVYGESTDNGPRNPIWASNMARMEEAGRMSDLDRNILEMESSDEEDAAVRPTKFARMASVPEFPTWNDLEAAHKLNLADAIAELYPDLAQVMHQLRLGLSQKEELVELLTQRQDRETREEANRQRLQEETKDVLLQGRSLSQMAFHQMVEENLYRAISEGDSVPTNLRELKKARAYLRYCGFDPALADEGWDVPSNSNAATGTKPTPAQSKPNASLSSTAALTPPRRSEGPFSRRPALFTPSQVSQQASYPPDPRFELVQQHSQGALPQHRPTPAHALIALHSPAAPLSKVPVQSYRVAPGNQGGDLRAGYQDTARIPQPTLLALPAQPNASTGPNLRAVNNPFLMARGASSDLPTLLEERSLPVGSHSLAPKDLPPTAPRLPARQSSANPNVGASAGQETDDVLYIGDSVNKKRRKKGDA
ncbi:MAG: hypothetical protein ALECFALPRED_010182 [Alectoria fallacina]|uniref:Uncharacterized protein n=1 Tax=Alectoria fallacina TaxID=1903189 RepID=A0A8H3PK11_9LECA|nr:MAG: hypothetical protein ALECFALPRED_010182 [Alectoria fallacina]